MKILVTGSNGQLGYDVLKELHRRKIPCRGIDREECCLLYTSWIRIPARREGLHPLLLCIQFDDGDHAQKAPIDRPQLIRRSSVHLSLIHIWRDMKRNPLPIHIFIDHEANRLFRKPPVIPIHKKETRFWDCLLYTSSRKRSRRIRQHKLFK